MKERKKERTKYREGGEGGGEEREREATKSDYIMLATKTIVTKTEPKIDAIVSVHLKTHERFLFIQQKTICKCIHQICLLSREANRLAGILQSKDFFFKQQLIFELCLNLPAICEFGREANKYRRKNRGGGGVCV